MPLRHDVAQVCLNGHIVNGASEMRAHCNARYCQRCGGKVIESCMTCGASIRGQLVGLNQVLGADMDAAPHFCHECGDPYPWTAQALTAARELIEGVDGLSDDDRHAASSDLEDLIRDTPRTPVAAARFSAVLSKVGGATAAAMQDLLMDVVAESAKRTIWGGAR